MKLRKVGDSIETTVPAEVLARLDVGDGDALQLIDTPDGVLLERLDPDFERQMEVARAVMSENTAVLHVLAK